ncbi:MAG TPA: peptide chain release factor N(5)-glutamine methyltransferase [Desulfomonilaceae bacterium]|nr:peptide chain release factor N(5)-glutamine methyltransferase [Desulfomonilaceae bacterium]
MEQQSKTPAQWTIAAVLNWTTQYLSSRGITTPRLDAEILLAHCLNVDRLYLYLNLDRPLLPHERSQYRDAVRRRALREPVALITGKKEFWSISLRIVPGVLIPRPETETLVEAVLQEIRENASPRVLEIGTGSGAVAVAVAKENSGAQVLATDINPVAVETARWNAKEAGVEASVQFVATDLFDSVRPGPCFDVICSNPPYVPSDVIPTLAPEIRNFEPLRSLDGGSDGLDTIRKLAAHARDYLKGSGALILEIGEGQEAAVETILRSVAGFSQVRIFRDLSGKARVVKGKTK